MIAVDTNVLVYAHREESPRHALAKARLKALAQGGAAWALPVFVLGEWVRVITHARVFDRPHTAAEACEAVRRLLASPSLVVLNPGPRYPELFLRCVEEGRAKGNLSFDAQIAALCLEAGATRLLTEDRDFARFKGLTLEHL